MPLTDAAIRKVRPPSKPTKMADERGLFLYLTPTGGKLWRFKYRIHGKEKVISFGGYPDVGLAQAREFRDEARRQLGQNLDPMRVRKEKEAAARFAISNSFANVARAWWQHWKAQRTEKHTLSVLRRLERDVFPTLGRRPIADIKSTDVVAMARKITDRGAFDIAKRMLQTTSQIFRFGIVQGLAETNPVAQIRPADVIPSRKKENYARLGPKEFPELLVKIEAYRGGPATRLALKLMSLTFVRTSELIGASWDEFNFADGEWRIPAHRMKMGSEHIVPLSRQALEVLETLRTVTGTGKLLFPGERDHKRSISNNTLLGALDRMGYKGRMTGHGFRGVASTALHEMGFEHMHIELQLAHAERNEISAAYNYALYVSQRRTMMQRWADYLDEQKSVYVKRSQTAG